MPVLQTSYVSINDSSRIIIDDSRVMLHIVASLADDSWSDIYNCNMFIELATEKVIVFFDVNQFQTSLIFAGKTIACLPLKRTSSLKAPLYLTVNFFVQLGFSSLTLSGLNLFCAEFRAADKSPAALQMKLTSL